MIGSVHLVDSGVRAAMAASRKAPVPGQVAGLRDARTMVSAPLGGRPPSPQLGRLGLVAFWDDEAALEAFLASHPLAATLEGGWSARLEPLRAVSIATGGWPGLPDDLPSGSVVSEGPVAVLTIGRVRVPRLVTFLRTSGRAERQVADAPGSLWATGMANIGQRVVSTFSLWESGEKAHAYAASTAGHSAAMRSQAERSFHHRASFVRFRPYSVTGSLAGRNPLPASVTERLNQLSPA